MYARASVVRHEDADPVDAAGMNTEIRRRSSGESRADIMTYPGMSFRAAMTRIARKTQFKVPTAAAWQLLTPETGSSAVVKCLRDARRNFRAKRRAPPASCSSRLH